MRVSLRHETLSTSMDIVGSQISHFEDEIRKTLLVMQEATEMQDATEASGLVKFQRFVRSKV